MLLSTVRDLDGEPIATVNAQFITSTFLPHTWLVIATPNDDDSNDDNPSAHLDHYGPFTDRDGARAWAEAHLAPYANRYTVAPLTAPYTYADVEKTQGKPVRTTPPRPARARTIARFFEPHQLTRLRYGTRPDTTRQGFTARESEHPELGPVVELTALGPDPYQRQCDHDLMKAVLHQFHLRRGHRPAHSPPRTPPLRRRTPHGRRPGRHPRHPAPDRPHHPAPGTCRDHRNGAHPVRRRPPGRAGDGVRRPRRLRLPGRGLGPHDVLADLKKASLPSDMIEPIVEALALLDPHTCPKRTKHTRPAPVSTRGRAVLAASSAPRLGSAYAVCGSCWCLPHGVPRPLP